MPQFLVTIYDGTDAQAPARRQATRTAHLEGLKGNVASGKVVFGGRIFDDSQQPVGSFLMADCADRAELDAIVSERARHDRLCELNVIRQVRNVASDVFVQDAWARGQDVSVHGWVYSLSTGLVNDLNVTVSRP